MSRKDDITGKTSLKGNKRSHAMNATNRQFKLNLQKVSIKDGDKVKKVRVTAKTARTLKKQGKIA